MKYIPITAAVLATFLLADPSTSQAQSSGAFSFGKPKAEAAETVEVEAKGQGESVEAAKKDAVRNAIKQAVGELVGAETLVENDELVKDKILTLSNAMIEKADYGEAKSIGDGLFEVPVKAVVKKGQLNKELKAVGIAEGAVAGDSLAATLFSGKERVANAEKFFAERFMDFPQNVMEAVMLTNDDGAPAIGFTPGSRKGIYWRDDLAEEGHLYADVGVRVNMENYAEWTSQMKELLDAICSSRQENSIPFAEMGGYDKDRLFGELPVNGNDGTPVVIANPKKPERATWPVTVYWLDDSIFKALGETLARTFPGNASLEIVLKDADGEIVCSAKALTDGGRNAALHNFADRTNYHPCKIGTYDFGAEYPTIPVSGMMQKINGFEGLFIGPIPGVAAKFHKGAFDPPTASRLKEVTKPFRLDLGVVSEKDLAEVTGYEVRLEYR